MSDKIDMIYDMVKETRADVKEVHTKVNDLCVKQENHDVRMGNIESSQKRLEDGQKKIKKDLYEHIANKKKHYNQGYKETITERIARKKVELTVITILTTVIGWAVNNYLGS